MVGNAQTMKDEFTTAAHAEMLGDEETELDVMVMGCYARMRREHSLKAALKAYPSITKEQFLENVVRVMSFKSLEAFESSYGRYFDL